MMRIILLIITNLAIMIMLGITWTILDSIFGFSASLEAAGIPSRFGFIAFFSIVLGFGGAFLSLRLSKWMAKRSMGVELIETPQNDSEQWLFNTVQRQAQQAGIGMPEVGIFYSPEPNAFATGHSKNNSLVAVSSGLLETMTPDEVEAVLGHEVSHIANGDMITQTLLQGILNTFVMFFARVIAYIVSQFVSGDDEEGSGASWWTYFIVSIIMDILLGILASAIVMWYSRKREFHADIGGAKLAGREKMIAALRRLQAGQEIHDLPGEMAAFGIAGGIGEGMRKVFLTHPPLEDRIAALENMTDQELQMA